MSVIIPIASGKGGVGKSLLSANLAIALGGFTDGIKLSNLVDDISVSNIIINDSIKSINRIYNELKNSAFSNYDISEDYVFAKLNDLYGEYKSLANLCNKCAENVINSVDTIVD